MAHLRSLSGLCCVECRLRRLSIQYGACRTFTIFALSRIMYTKQRTEKNHLFGDLDLPVLPGLLVRLPCTIQYGDSLLGSADMRTGARHCSARKRSTRLRHLVCGFTALFRNSVVCKLHSSRTTHQLMYRNRQEL